jgi:hypothetical protein
LVVEDEDVTQTLSSPTLAVLIKIAIGPTMKEINTSLLAANLDRFITVTSSKESLVQTVLLAARKAAEEGDKDAHRGLLAFAKEQTRLFLPPSQHGPESQLFQLKDALLADGYELRWDETTTEVEGPFGETLIEPGPVIYHIRPTDSPGAKMAEEITALEAQLAAAGFDVALNHYKQAIDNLSHHNYEASNSALRPMLEDVTFRVAQKYGYGGTSGGNAINFMVDQKQFVPKGWGSLLQGAWAISHGEGSHPGRSDADEARFRMSIITSIVRRLLQHAGI